MSFQGCRGVLNQCDTTVTPKEEEESDVPKKGKSLSKWKYLDANILFQTRSSYVASYFTVQQRNNLFVDLLCLPFFLFLCVQLK